MHFFNPVKFAAEDVEDFGAATISDSSTTATVDLTCVDETGLAGGVDESPPPSAVVEGVGVMGGRGDPGGNIVLDDDSSGPLEDFCSSFLNK
jgi:hypothetical protein